MNRGLANVRTLLCLVALSQPLAASAQTTPKVETVLLSGLKAGGTNFKGKIQYADLAEDDAPKAPLFQKYGTRTFSSFEKHPELVASLKKLNPKFDPHTMASSNLSGIATFEGRTVLILSGCFPHNCGGTQQIVAFEPATKRIYLLQPTNLGPNTEPSGKFYLYGDPDGALRAAIFSAYPD
ncbi:MAG: inhibitor of vertebrate lysozyme family protein [Verrucomicrobiota bacterium]|nr:inhibitor of vertebrate lysozyme family protein [Verrucomicrobiota bacterium]